MKISNTNFSINTNNSHYTRNSLTLSHLREFCSRQHYLNFGENLIYWYKSKWQFQIEFKTLWKKEKLLHWSNFSFCHNVFKCCLLMGRSKSLADSNELNQHRTVRSQIIQALYYHMNQVVRIMTFSFFAMGSDRDF